ncbi:MAG: hypothetical protein JWP57_1185 [Spirosoma sp.]|nr:hypothetical protein [Spirosoma sp.]
MNIEVNYTPTVRQQATTLAWQIVKAVKLPFKTAQAQAWATVKLLAKMQNGPTEFTYIKDDRTQRLAIGESPTPDSSKPFVIRYRDLEADGIRSFRADRLVIA